MLIIQLTGGLGNQLFQYAAARAHMLRLDTELYLDKTHFLPTPTGKKNLRQYELHHFNVIERFRKPAFHWVKKYFRVKNMYVAAKTFRETHVHIHPEFFEISGDTYIEGCFQSEKYFKQYENVIRKELSFKTKATGKNAELLEKIKTVNAVSLHVRRGDYVSNSETLKVHGVCGLDYYERAVKHIESVIDNPHFFLFSDEPEWVQQNLTLNHPYEIINHNKGESSFEDIRLMSACNHHIIANSSFSWWGAWLNPSENKIVIAPERWFADKQHNSNDIIPEKWLKV